MNISMFVFVIIHGLSFIIILHGFHIIHNTHKHIYIHTYTVVYIQHMYPIGIVGKQLCLHCIMCVYKYIYYMKYDMPTVYCIRIQYAIALREISL